MAVTQTLLSSAPPFGNRDGYINVRFSFSGTYAGHVIDLQALNIPHLSPDDFSKLSFSRTGGAADGKDFKIQNTLTVTDVSTANPGVVTVGELHNLTTGDSVTVASTGGTTEANDTWDITVTATDKFSIPVEVTNTYTSGGTVTVTPALDWCGVLRLYTAGTSTQASSTVATTVDLHIDWIKGVV